MQTSQISAPSRTIVDQWPVDTAGLSPRVVHCLNHAGVKTVGELRHWSDDQLLRLRHFGITSLANVRWFFHLSKHAEAQVTHFTHFHRLVAEFLNKQELFVVEQRFGLADPLFRPHMRRKTLQEIADMLGGMTRERVRQVEEEALRTLRSFLCRELTQPFERHWVNRIQERGGVITSAELSDWASDPQFGGYQPWGVLLMLSEVTDSIHFHFDYFSTITPKALGRIEERVFALLQREQTLVPFERIKQDVSEVINEPNGHFMRVLTVVLNHHPDICGTNDGRYFLPATGTPQVVQDVFQQEARPLHFCEVAEFFNQRMLPGSQRRSGYILRTLNLMANVQRVTRAVYELKPH